MEKSKKYSFSAIAGTPEYLPPESYLENNELLPTVDFWSFGSLIFEMVTGFPPFFVGKLNISELKSKVIN